jgi:hypothetical protein
VICAPSVSAHILREEYCRRLVLASLEQLLVRRKINMDVTLCGDTVGTSTSTDTLVPSTCQSWHCVGFWAEYRLAYLQWPLVSSYKYFQFCSHDPRESLVKDGRRVACLLESKAS